MESLSNASKFAFNPTNWLPVWAQQPASGHRQVPSLARNGHNNASQTFSSLTDEIDSATSFCFWGIEWEHFCGPSSTSSVHSPFFVKFTLQPSDCRALDMTPRSLIALFADSLAARLIFLSLRNSSLSDSTVEDNASIFLSASSFPCSSFSNTRSNQTQASQLTIIACVRPMHYLFHL